MFCVGGVCVISDLFVVMCSGFVIYLLLFLSSGFCVMVIVIFCCSLSVDNCRSWIDCCS